MNPLDVKILVAARMRQAQECLEDAKSLLSLGRGTRSVVNRAYYAAFYAVLALLQTKGKVPQKHIGTVSLFDSEFVKTDLLPKELSTTLHVLFERRCEDDYERIDDIDLSEARESLDMADRFVQSVRDYLDSTDSI